MREFFIFFMRKLYFISLQFKSEFAELSSSSNSANGRELFRWKKLILSKGGLWLKSGWRVQCWCYPICDEDHDSGVNRSRRQQPTAKVVRKYELAATTLKKNLAKIK